MTLGGKETFTAAEMTALGQGAAFGAYLFPGAGRGPDSTRSVEGTLARAFVVQDWPPAYAGEQQGA